jgi:hypothetical protein
MEYAMGESKDVYFRERADELAKAAMGTLYDSSGKITGPTDPAETLVQRIRGCSLTEENPGLRVHP